MIIALALEISGNAGNVVVQCKSLGLLGDTEGGLEATVRHGTSTDAIASAVLAAGWLRTCLAVAAIAVGRLAWNTVVDVGRFVAGPDGARWDSRRQLGIAKFRSATGLVGPTTASLDGADPVVNNAVAGSSSFLGLLLSEKPSLGDARNGEGDDEGAGDLHSCGNCRENEGLVAASRFVFGLLCNRMCLFELCLPDL